MIYFNYITTNNINGKQYIGAHSTKKLDDGYLGSGILLHKICVFVNRILYTLYLK